ncbi:GntR family transcriptional regulator [Steroidobacter sp.]|uniref:GntR family transcriptional regulator n=1 Tax=Steroidobacter sp. TaxID=1978227 RepID=UPI001A489A3C|nr:GntR family transcriptional regulator [Steroidobacter sp.]MBL8265968.1 GntR family transcriptional regulator [Steroidobacter sp.]
MTDQSVPQLASEIAQQIVSYARRKGLSAGARLAQRTLAEEFGVSRSPIRSAMKLLADRGIMQIDDETGTYVLAELPDSEDFDSGVVPSSPVETLYMSLVKDRFAGELLEDVTESDLMRRYSVARAVLRHALLRLANEGLVQRRRGYGWHFLPMIDSKEADRQSYQYRLAIEPAVLRSETFKPVQDRLLRCRAAHAEMLAGMIERVSGARFYELNTEFHEMLAEFSGNTFFLQAIQQQHRLRRAVEYESFVWSERMRESCQEHINVIDAIVAGDMEWAASLMIHHLKMSQRGGLPFAATLPAGE